MATIVITNLTANDIYLGDFYLNVPGNSSRTLENRSATEVNAPSLAREITAGTLSVTVTPSADEKAAGVIAPDASVEARDVAPVASSAIQAVPIQLFKVLAPGGGGAADDVTIYAVNNLPYKIRITDVLAMINAGAAGGRSLAVRSAAGGGGTLVSTLPATANGPSRPDATNTATVVLAPGALIGLFVRRSDSAIGGEIIITARRED